MHQPQKQAHWRALVLEAFLSLFVVTALLTCAEYAWPGSVSRFLSTSIFPILTTFLGLIVVILDTKVEDGPMSRFMVLPVILGGLVLFLISDLSLLGRVLFGLGYVLLICATLYPKVIGFREVDE